MEIKQRLGSNEDILGKIAGMTGLGWTASLLVYLGIVMGYSTALITNPQSLLYLGGILLLTTLGLDQLKDTLSNRASQWKAPQIGVALFSLVGWLYIMIKQPYSVGDRANIAEPRGDAFDGNYLAPTPWKINEHLVSSNQPPGWLVTLSNSTVRSTQTCNYPWSAFPQVYNEIPLQVAYETELELARQQLVQAANEYLDEK